MVALFSNCEAAHRLLQSHGDLKRKWNWAVEWLGDELDRRPYSGNTQYTYNSWSPPAQSNEISNGYFLERSHSARITLEKACQLCPEEEPDEPEMMDEHEGSDPQDEAPVPTTYPQSLPHLQTAPNNQQQGQPSPPPSSSLSSTTTSSSQQQQQTRQQPPVTAQNSQSQPQVPNNQQPAQTAPPNSGQVGSLHKHPNTINNTLNSPEQGGNTSPTTTTGTPTPHPQPPPPEEQDEKTEGGSNKET